MTPCLPDTFEQYTFFSTYQDHFTFHMHTHSLFILGGLSLFYIVIEYITLNQYNHTLVNC